MKLPALPAFDFDVMVEDHLDLQVKISYSSHHDFLLRHRLGDCVRVLDAGTGNGTFAARLAEDHPGIQFTGVDKRKHCIEASKKHPQSNFDAQVVDLFSRSGSFDFSQFDGILMRYFLLHVDHSRKILELFKEKAKRPSRFWIIDLDFTQFTCEPRHDSFDALTRLVKEFCLKTSIDSLAGKRVRPLLEELGYDKIQQENIPFTEQNVSLKDLCLYLRQEVICYSRMGGKGLDDAETLKIIKFVDEDLSQGGYAISYGMVLFSAEPTQ